MKRHARYLALLGTFGLIFIATLISVSTTSALKFASSQTMEFTFNPALNLSLSSNELNINNLSSGNTGVSNAITIDIDTNTFSRLLLNATVGSSANATTSLVHNQSSSYKFDSIATNASVSSLNTHSDTWGYATYDNDEDGPWSNYSGLPLYNTTPKALINDNTNAPKSHSIDFRISAAADIDQPAGVYTNQINFSAVVEPIVYTYGIWYLAGGGLNVSDVTNMPTSEFNIPTLTPSVTIVLSSTVPVSSGHIFNGWCTQNTNPGSDHSCQGELLQPGDSYTFNITGSSYTLGLWGTWDQSTMSFDSAFAAAGKSKYQNYYKMQDMTHSICGVVAVGQESQLIDSRDNKVYYVAKLADGSCFMTQNLDHNISSSYDYDSTNTDVPSDWDEELEPTSDTTWESLQSEPWSYDIGDYCWNEEFDEDSGIVSCSQSGHHYHLGNYYNWTAAMASEGSPDSTAGRINQSICPAGWTLPDADGSLSASSLSSLYDDPFDLPLYFTLGGAMGLSIQSVSFSDNFGSNASYIYGNNGGRYLEINSDGDFKNMTTGPQVGFSIRCVAR